MTYQPHQWKVGDKITSARLNNIENGITAANEIIFIDQDNEALNASYNDIKNYINAGKLVFIRQHSSSQSSEWFQLLLVDIYQQYGSHYTVLAQDRQFTSSSPTDYLILANGR